MTDILDVLAGVEYAIVGVAIVAILRLLAFVAIFFAILFLRPPSSYLRTNRLKKN